MKTLFNVFIFLLIILASFLYVGKAITDLTGGEKQISGGAVELSPEDGETLFWGKGRCFTCHSMGERGSAVRGPNLGRWGEKFLLPVGSRAEERAKERSDQTGTKYSATDYLVESLADPGAYLVEGYKNDMAVVFAPPIALSLDEIKAIVLYLQSQGGSVDVEGLNNPDEVARKYYDKIIAASASGGGDPGRGRIVFEDNCSTCHMIGNVGAKIGPDLSSVGRKGLKYISESILRPSHVIVKGYETYIVVSRVGGQCKGIKSRDEAAEVDITKADGSVITIARGDLLDMKVDENVSLMPEDLFESLSVKDYYDLLSFLLMQKGEKE